MNVFVADPHWRWWIVGYFFLGGIAAGAYFLATLIDLFGREEDRLLSRAGYLIAFPLIAVCGLLLILDLHQPLRFWHMLLKSEVVHAGIQAGWPWTADGWRWMIRAPLLKYWSPMSIGSWALLVFGGVSLISLWGAVRQRGLVHHLMSCRYVGTVVRIVGCAVGFFVAAYTGALLTATNQPLWSDSVWIASLFLCSAASTGIAAMLLLNLRREWMMADSLRRLERADLWALVLEFAVFVIFLGSLGPLLVSVLQSTNGKLLVVGTLGLGILLPLAIHLRLGSPSLALRLGRRAAVTAAVFVLVGGFVLRYALLTTPPELLAHQRPDGSAAASLVEFGSEAGRPRGGGPGADPGNRVEVVKPRSRIFK